MKLLLCLALHLITLPHIFAVSSVKCLNEDGKAVDWWFIYKLPRNKKQVHEGLTYSYADIKNPELKLHSISLNSSDSPLGRTINQYYERKNNELGYFFYNDEHPHKTSGSHGHTKGFGIFGENGGVWIVHSAPKFPTNMDAFSYPDGETIYGQNFLCIHVSLESFNTIGKAFLYNYPFFYKTKQVPSAFSKNLPNLVQALNREHVKKPPYYMIDALYTRTNKVKFNLFAKFTKFGKDIVSELLAPTMKSSLYSETWLRGHTSLKSECTSIYKVYRVIKMKVGGLSFKETHDHSKLAVGVNTTVVCSGDINRMTSQYERGGGYLCMRNAKLSKSLQNAVIKFQDCK